MTLNIYEWKPLTLWGHNAKGEVCAAPGVMDRDGVYTESGEELVGDFSFSGLWNYARYNGPSVNYDGEEFWIEKIFLED